MTTLTDAALFATTFLLSMVTVGAVLGLRYVPPGQPKIEP